MQVCDKNTPVFAKPYLSRSLDGNEKHLFGFSLNMQALVPNVLADFA